MDIFLFEFKRIIIFRGNIIYSNFNKVPKVKERKKEKADMITDDIKMSDGYYKILNDSHMNKYIEKYVFIISEFVEFVINDRFKHKEGYQNYVLVKGLESLLHIYMMILMYTCNVEMACLNMNKAYYYYIEFIEQIHKDEHYFLRFNLRDAILFIYKKTIYELIPTYVNDFTISEPNKEILEKLRSKLEILNEVFLYYLLDIRIELEDTKGEIKNKMEYRKKLEEWLICILKNDKFTKCIQVYDDVKKNNIPLIERIDMCINILPK